MSNAALPPEQPRHTHEESVSAARMSEKLPWEAPELQEFGPITTVVKGFAFRAGDAISNLS